MRAVEKKSKIGEPLISVITIVYNGVMDIERTLNSVASQSYKNIEYIVVDGCSTDGTVDVIKKYKNSIDVWVSEKDQGISDAFNKGIKMTSGEYLIFMNCGDIFHSDDVVNNVIPCLLSNPCAVVYGNALVGGKCINTDHSRILLKRFLSNPICHQAVFVPAIIHQSILYDTKYRYSMDFDLWHRLICIEHIPFVKINMIVSDYMVGGITSSIQNLEKVIYEHWLVKQQYLRSENNILELCVIAGKILGAKIKTVFRLVLGDSLYEVMKRKMCAT
ncbi:glycosyltransferase [Chlorobaculum sp. 24CR]|uniref:glycosyltransferase family 2 protein n=1 Tax=Chlorobaculum sp. 24CR TaxID=2508878 RepID=UPI00100A8E01|nr:glycosyltransferase family 2 protein [Chlorobaculum sp. 24CR]RXK80444.1 glycosyltransferase [Chlorobaculum sp. 24CR]